MPWSAWNAVLSGMKDSSKNHKIVDNGYNLGRDWLVEKATAGSRWNGRWWRADVEWNEQDLLNEGSSGKQSRPLITVTPGGFSAPSESTF